MKEPEGDRPQAKPASKRNRKPRGTKVNPKEVTKLQAKGFNQEAIAKKLGVSKRTVIRYLQRKKEPAEMALLALSSSVFISLFDRIGKPQAVHLFLLKFLNHVDWQQHWAGRPKARKEAAAIEKSFVEWLRSFGEGFEDVT